MALNSKVSGMRRTLNLGFVRVTMYLLIGGVIISGCLPEPLDVKGIPVVKPQIVVSTQLFQTNP